MLDESIPDNAVRAAFSAITAGLFVCSRWLTVTLNNASDYRTKGVRWIVKCDPENYDVILDCCQFFEFTLPSEYLAKKAEKFILRCKNCSSLHWYGTLPLL